jgi:hypothetical protein
MDNTIIVALDMMHSDMKDLSKTMTALEIDVALVKDKLKM